MAYAVIFYFDEISTRQIQKVWKELYEKNISPAMYSLDIQPHITLAIYDSFDCSECEKEINKFAENFDLISINANHFGIFPHASTVIFIAPAPNKELINLQINIHHSLEDYVSGSWKMYQPGNWVPHITLVRDIEKENFSKALEICMKMPLPLELKITQIGVVNFEPVKQLFEIDLGLNKRIL